MTKSTIIQILMIVACFISTQHALTDKEIETIKHVVDKELIKRELDLLKEDTERPNEVVHPLGGRVKPTKPATKSKPMAKKLRTTKAPKKKTTTESGPSPEEYHLQGSIDNCIDIYDTDKCKVLVQEGMDCNKDDMHLLCERSCGFCGNHGFPVDCTKTTFGCCSDKLTPKSDYFGKNCPRCEDKVPDLCEPHVNDCNEIGMVGNWMRMNCKKSCHVCIPDHTAVAKNPEPTCTDDEDQAVFCPHWKESRLCKPLKSLMKKHCRKTCDFCGEK